MDKGGRSVRLGKVAKAMESTKVVRSKDVLEAIGTLLVPLKGKHLSVSDVGLRIYQCLSEVPEFTVAVDALEPTARLTGNSADSQEAT